MRTRTVNTDHTARLAGLVKARVKEKGISYPLAAWQIIREQNLGEHAEYWVSEVMAYCGKLGAAERAKRAVNSQKRREYRQRKKADEEFVLLRKEAARDHDVLRCEEHQQQIAELCSYDSCPVD